MGRRVCDCNNLPLLERARWQQTIAFSKLRGWSRSSKASGRKRRAPEREARAHSCVIGPNGAARRRYSTVTKFLIPTEGRSCSKDRTSRREAGAGRPTGIVGLSRFLRPFPTWTVLENVASACRPTGRLITSGNARSLDSLDARAMELLDTVGRRFCRHVTVELAYGRKRARKSPRRWRPSGVDAAGRDTRDGTRGRGTA